MGRVDISSLVVGGWSAVLSLPWSEMSLTVSTGGNTLSSCLEHTPLRSSGKFVFLDNKLVSTPTGYKYTYIWCWIRDAGKLLEAISVGSMVIYTPTGPICCMQSGKSGKISWFHRGGEREFGEHLKRFEEFRVKNRKGRGHRKWRHTCSWSHAKKKKLHVLRTPRCSWIKPQGNRIE